MILFFFKRNLYLTSIFILLFNFNTYSQNYVDLVKVKYANVFNAGFEGSDAKTNVELIDFKLTYPIKLNEKTAIITGIDYTQQSVSLYPSSDNTTLSNITIKAGLSIKHSKKLSGTYIILPRLSSENLHINGNDFFFGGVALLKYQKSDKFQWRFGVYGSSEGFGALFTPIIGAYYLSENKKFELNANLPIDLDANYTLSNTASLGLGLDTPVKSYSLKEDTVTNVQNYVQVSNIEFGPYFEKRFLDNSLLLRLQTGYSTINYETFEEGDTLPFRLSAFEFGDDRNLLNPKMTGNLFARIGLIYRFHLDNN